MNDMDLLREDRRRLAEDLRLVLRDADSVLRHKLTDVTDDYAEARDRLEQTIAEAKDRLSGVERSLRRGAEEAVKDTDKLVRSHPWESMGVGVGVGMLIGLLVGRK
ncbi:MAG: DUF883 family protein [Burkholderiaceae bacterium]